MAMATSTKDDKRYRVSSMRKPLPFLRVWEQPPFIVRKINNSERTSNKGLWRTTPESEAFKKSVFVYLILHRTEALNLLNQTNSPTNILKVL